MNQLILSAQALNIFSRKKIGDFTSIRLNRDDVIICTREERQLVSYKYVASTGTWRQYWNETVFDQEGDYPLDRYPWLVADNLIPNEKAILLRHPNGMQIYQLDQTKPGLKLLKEDLKFNDFFRGDLIMGNFYPDAQYVGVMTRDVNRKVRFYATTLRPNKPPLSLLDVDIPFPSWTAAETEFFVTKLLNKDSEVIGLRTNEGLEFYQFNSDYLLEQVAKTSVIAKSQQNISIKDYLYFANLTRNIYQDILYLNSSGLFTYQYNDEQKDYRFIHLNDEFTEPYGWLPRYGDSIKLIDLNDDNQDDLLFTGTQGITALSFDTITNNWIHLLNSELLPGSQRYADVVGILPPIQPMISHPSIFIQDLEGNVQWAKILPEPLPTTTTSSPINSTSMITTTDPSQIVESDVVLPQQIPRKILPNRPTLRWSEQWDDSFLKQVVEPASGQAQMYVPLVDIFPLTGWRLQLGLSYSSQSSNSDLFGLGWSMPLAQDYITIDHRGSIYPEDAHYYLVTQERMQKLQLIGNKMGVYRFELEKLNETDDDGLQISIEYHSSKQQWIIEGHSEKSTYGKADHSLAQDALQWSLSWPHWRGVGSDKRTQQPLVTSWYLNRRFDKDNQKALYYHYEKDETTIDGGKGYDAAVRLKAISDGQDMKLQFEYAPKQSKEYSSHNPVDKDGNIIFPVSLLQSHYIKGYSITTTTYSQTFKFLYEVNNGKRLLSSMEQEILSHTEPILNFGYQTLNDRYVLQSCTYLPKGSSVQLNFQTQTKPDLSIVNNYPIRESAKIAYGSDYALLAYQDFNQTAGKVIFRIMNRSMTQTSVDCTFSNDLKCPSSEYEIKDYHIQAYQNSFIVHIESTENQSIHIFNRHKETWSAESTVYRFHKQALIKFTETLIVATNPEDKTILLFRRTPKQSKWSNYTFTLSRAITELVLQNTLIVSYDDKDLHIFYYDDKAGWQRKYLDYNKPNGVGVFNLFEIESKIKQQIVTALKKNSLQIMNNFILLNTIHENGGKLSTLSHLYLLDSEHNIAKKQSININRERINDLTYEVKNDGSVYKIFYTKENKRFKAKIKGVSGKIIEDLISNNRISNKNIKKDLRNGSHPLVKDIIKQLNEAKGWKEALNKALLINLNLYMAQIGQQGVHIGSDTLLRITGTGWEKESLPTVQTTPLGKHFILEKDPKEKSIIRLYKQDGNGGKQGDQIQELKLHTSGPIVNVYPAYIAYQTTSNAVKVITFKDGQTLDKDYVFSDEELLPESDMQNLITIANATSTEMKHAESQECRVRIVSTLLAPKVEPFVSQVTLTANDVKRVTTYEHYFDVDQRTLTYKEKVIIIPGGDKKTYGWQEAMRSYHRGNVTKTERWFNADGGEVLAPPDEAEEEEAIKTKTNSKPDPMILWDRSKKSVISDFSPYSMADEMVAYYGFEPYENDQIGIPADNAQTKSWRIVEGKIVKEQFAFAGHHFLQLQGKSSNDSSFLEGIFQPLDQEITYIATCWIRCSTPIMVNTVTPNLRAIIHTTSGQKIIGLQAKVKHQLGDWSYLELRLDFKVIRSIYRDYMNYNASVATNNVLPSDEDVTFKITLRVEAPTGETLDVDHIRFTPITHDFQAAVYHPIVGKPEAIIQANGLVLRTIYNRLQQEIASTNEEGQLQEFSTTSRTGKLIPAQQGSGIDSRPNVITFEPESGSYENFDANSWRSRWKLSNSDAWLSASGQLWHKHPDKHHIEASRHLFDETSAAIRFYFSLQNSESSLSLHWQGIGSLTMTRQSDHFATLILPDNKSITTLPSTGELIVMLEENYLWVWIDGVLLVDHLLAVDRTLTTPLTPWSSFKLEAQGDVLVEDCLIMNRPRVTVKYFNEFGEKTQEIHLENTTTAQVKEVLYDALGRDAITTKTTRIERKAGQSLLTYRPDFVINENPLNEQSVWQTGKLEGEANQLNPADQGYAYKRTEYAPNPLNQEQTIGLPGPEFSITGRCASKIDQHSNIAFLTNVFPPDRGYRQKAEHTSNDSLRINIFDKNNNEIAKYVRVKGFNHQLSTYEYDKENRLIKILPPLYHENVDTARRTTPWQAGEQNLSSEEKHWQEALATRFVYDEYGHLVRKITPDTGTTEYLYNAAGQMRFMISNQTGKIIYFTYDENNQLITTGRINGTLSITTLNQYLESDFVPNAEEYQKFDYADDHLDPLMRGRIKQYITHNDGEVIVEHLHFGAYQQVLSKKTILNRSEPDPFANFEKKYVNDKLQNLIYPATVDGQPLNLVHSYNKFGQLIGLGTPSDPTHYASFTYHATGQLASEQYQPNTDRTFTRNYNYNSPGFLEKISDPFLTENIAYTQRGYGQVGFGDGMVMQAAFNASWPVNADGRWFQIHENDLGGNFSALCVKALKRTGYLTDSGQPIKLYIRDTEQALPLQCGGETARDMAKLIAQKLKSTYYGYRYAYGNHQELVKAKYFTDDTESISDPLQPDTFSKEISDLTLEDSQHIWQLLADAGYIITDQEREDKRTAVGKRGHSIFRNKELHDDLLALNDKYTLYDEPIERFIISAISQQRTLSQTDFDEIFLNWQGLDQSSSKLIYNEKLKVAKEIGQMLIEKGYLPTNTNDFTHSLSTKFTTALHEYTELIPNIVKTLSEHFSNELGKTAFDVQSYKIDANGNHRLFYNGFDRYDLTYRNASNQIENITLGRIPELSTEINNFSMKHDGEGNVIQAMHKNIKHIDYHPVSQRTTRITLTDGRTLRFHYDAHGERVLKRVFNPDGSVSHERHYLRDETGKVLMDRQTKYLGGSVQKIVTAYLYGPRGLVGFIRNNAFYSVTTDHSGSVRVVIKDGRVVAAYDYLPYGGLMRSYGNDPQAHIVYRFTGQEWDEETDLYNYHARLYDPSIGRFYQIDPKAQYFSPYKYAGNSPISVVDPDGEFAFLIACIILGLAGAYLGGAAANRSWNLLKWDYKNPRTWLGIIGGGIAGGLLPLGFTASVNFIGGLLGGSTIAGTIGTTALGIGGAYLITAANHGWDPTKWKWDQPDIWSSLFQGFSIGAGIAGGIGITHSFANNGKAILYLGNLKALNAIGIGQRAVKGIFLTISYGSAGSIGVVRGAIANGGNFAFWEWDWTNPATWAGLIDGFDTGMGWPQNIMEIARGTAKLFKNPKKYLFSGQNHFKLKSILKDSKNPLFKAATGVVMAYYMGSAANGEFDITKWNLSVFSTYEGVMNGVFFGKDISKTLKYIHGTKKSQPSNGLVPIFKSKAKNWAKNINQMLDFIQGSRIEGKYKYFVEQAFTVNTLWLAKLAHESSSIKNLAENFFKNGMKKWKNGENPIPNELQRIILNEAKLRVKGDSELTKWKAENEEILRRKREVFPDEEDMAFLNCKRTKRMKRQNPTTSHCSPISSDINNNEDTKQELIEQFFESKDHGIPNKNGFIQIKSIPPNSGNEVSLHHTNLMKSNTHYFDPSQPVGFAQHLSLVLSKTPNVLAPAKSSFYPNLILGSILTLHTSNVKNTNVHVKIEDVEVMIPNLGGEYGNSRAGAQILKTYYKDGNNLVLKTFIFEPKSYKNIRNGREVIEPIPNDAFVHVQEQLDIKSRYSEAELNTILSKSEFRQLDVNRISLFIKENIFYISNDRQLSVAENNFDNRILYGNRVKDRIEAFTRDLNSKRAGSSRNAKTQLQSYLMSLGLNEIANKIVNSQSRLNEADLRTLKDTFAETLTKRDFKHIDSTIENIDLKNMNQLLEKISSNEISKVEEGIREFSEELLKIYNDNANVFGFDLNSESGFHGFLYGALSLNFKYRHNLDIYVERIAGRGYSDLMLLSRDGPDGNKNWHAIPIIVELKADTTSPDRATAQTINTGYLYNLSMRTISQKALVVGINSKLTLPANPTAGNINNALKNAVTVKQEDIPQSEGFIQKLKQVVNANVNYRDAESNLQKEFKHIYYSISPLAIKTNDRSNNQYLSRLILGEITSHKNRDLYVKDNDELTTFVFKEDNKWIMLNLIESSERVHDKYEFKNINIDDKIKLPILRNEQIQNFIRIDVKVNSKSKHGWSSGERHSHGSNPKDFYFQSIAVTNGNVNLQKTQFHKLNSIDMDRYFSADNIMMDGIMDNLSQSLNSIKDTINSESDFQAVLQGLFYGYAKEIAKGNTGRIIKVFPEANLSREGRCDLIISILDKLPNKQIRERSLFVMELKYSNGDGTTELRNANKQVKKYATNLKSVSDLPGFTPITAVFCKNCNTGAVKFEVHPPQSIQHTSNLDSQYIQRNEQLNSPTNILKGIDTLSLDDLESPRSSNFNIEPSNSKRPRPEQRKRRSIDDTDSYSNESISNFADKLFFNDEVNNFETVSSGSTKLHFWPVNFVKRTGAAVSSLLAAIWMPLDTKNVVDDDMTYPHPEIVNEPQSSFEGTENDPTVLDMGDQWLNSNNIDGLLTWGILLARKLTGYRPKGFEEQSPDHAINIISSIQSHELVNEFKEMLLEQAEAYGVDVSDILENTKLYTKSIEAVHRMIATEQLETIIDYLFVQIVMKNIKKLVSKSTKNQSNEFLSSLRKDLPIIKQNIREKLSVQEQNDINPSTNNHLKDIVYNSRSIDPIADIPMSIGNTCNINYNIAIKGHGTNLVNSKY